jgi:ammonia channel protein AmtB
MEALFMLYQMTFAIIAVALVAGFVAPWHGIVIELIAGSASRNMARLYGNWIPPLHSP